VRLLPASVGRVDIDVIDPGAGGALILIVDFHDLDLLVAIEQQFLLVLGHQILADGELPDLFGGFHLYDHVVEEEEGLGLDGLERLEDVSVLLPVEVEGVFGVELGLQLLHSIKPILPKSEAINCILSPPSATILAKRKS